MKFLQVLISDENGEMPPPSLFEEMETYVGKAIEDGTVVETGGLAPIAQAKVATLEDGDINVTDGPYSEAKEVVGGFAIVEYDTLEEAVQGSVDFLDLHRRHMPNFRGRSVTRQILGPDDFEPPSA